MDVFTELTDILERGLIVPVMLALVVFLQLPGELLPDDPLLDELCVNDLRVTVLFLA